LSKKYHCLVNVKLDHRSGRVAESKFMARARPATGSFGSGWVGFGVFSCNLRVSSGWVGVFFLNSSENFGPYPTHCMVGSGFFGCVGSSLSGLAAQTRYIHCWWLMLIYSEKKSIVVW
jgi:hypothetical protein